MSVHSFTVSLLLGNDFEVISNRIASSSLSVYLFQLYSKMQFSEITLVIVIE